MVRYWWVNQNQTYQFEVPGGFLWSPKRRKDGGGNRFYDSMTEVRPGDIVFSFCDTFIRAVGVVQRAAVTAAKPDFRTAGSNWSNEGWFVEVEFVELDSPIRPKDFMPQIAPLLAEKYAPLQANGKGLQGVYPTEISTEFAQLLTMLTDANLPSIQHELAPSVDAESDYEINLEIEAMHLEEDLEKIQLTKSDEAKAFLRPTTDFWKRNAE